MTTETSKEPKLFIGGVEIKGVGSWRFHFFESDEEAEKAVGEIDKMYAEHYAGVIGVDFSKDS